MMGDVSERRIIVEGYAAAEVTDMVAALRGLAGEVADPRLVIDVDALVTWLEEQAEDESLGTAMAAGSLDASPVDALMAELIRRARE